ncbi:hypothetical protein Lser_V15G33746 [Lactuca serriola]
MDIFISRILIAYQSLSDPKAYKSDPHNLFKYAQVPSSKNVHLYGYLFNIFMSIFMYPLLAACKSISNLRKDAAQEVVEKVRHHSCLLVDQLGLILKLRDMIIGWIPEGVSELL